MRYQKVNGEKGESRKGDVYVDLLALTGLVLTLSVACVASGLVGIVSVMLTAG